MEYGPITMIWKSYHDLNHIVTTAVVLYSICVFPQYVLDHLGLSSSESHCIISYVKNNHRTGHAVFLIEYREMVG